MKEIFLDGIALSADKRTFFKGLVHGDLEKPMGTWSFGIDNNVHPYITQDNVPKLKNILVALSDIQGRQYE